MANQEKNANSTSDNRLLMDQVFQLDALTRLLLKKGIISEGELSRQLDAIKEEFEKRRSPTKA